MQTRAGSMMPPIRQRLHAIAEVVLHLAAPLAVPAELEGLTKSAGPAEVGLKHGISSGREVLHPGVEFEPVAHLRTTMGQQYQRQTLCVLRARWIGEISGLLFSVARLVRDDGGGGHRAVAQRALLNAHELDRLLVHEVIVEGRRIARAFHAQQYGLVVLGGVDDVDVRRFLEKLAQAAHVGVLARIREVADAHMRVIAVIQQLRCHRSATPPARCHAPGSRTAPRRMPRSAHRIDRCRYGPCRAGAPARRTWWDRWTDR